MRYVFLAGWLMFVLGSVLMITEGFVDHRSSVQPPENMKLIACALWVIGSVVMLVTFALAPEVFQP